MNSTVCPSDKVSPDTGITSHLSSQPDHVSSPPWWEVWRKRCAEDNCNIDAPRGSSEGDPEAGGGYNMCDTLDNCRLLVKPRSSAERIALFQNAFVLLVVGFLIK